MMKRFVYLSAAFLLIACTVQELPKAAPGDTPLRFVASSTSKAAFTIGLDSLLWQNGDRVGIYAEKAGQSAGVNYPYSVSSENGTSAELSPLTSAWQYGSADVSGNTFYAYYPFAGTAGEGNRFVVPASIPSIQEQAAADDFAHLGDYLLMKSFPATAGPDGGAVNLRFRNLSAVAEIRISAAGGCDRRISAAVLRAAAPLSFDKGNLLVQVSPDGEESPLQINEAADSVMLELTAPLALSAQEQSLFFTLLPGSHAASSLQLRLIADDGSEALLDLPEAVTFKANGIYGKSISVSGTDFGDEPQVHYVWKPVTTTAGVTAGDYIIAFNYNYSDTADVFLLPTTPVAKNPLPSLLKDVATLDGTGTITEIAAGYFWNFAASGESWIISCTVADAKYLLGACDQAQGVAISSDGKGSYATQSKEYGTLWTLSDDPSYGIQMSVSVSTRRLMPWYDPVNGPFTFEWRMAKVNTGGFILYKKTVADED